MAVRTGIKNITIPKIQEINKIYNSDISLTMKMVGIMCGVSASTVCSHIFIPRKQGRYNLK